MDVTIDLFRKEAAKRKRGLRRGPSGYPAALRQFAVRYARDAQAQGGTVAQAAKELGVSDLTLNKWVKTGGGGVAAAGVAAFREVVVEPEQPAATALVVTTASGLRVEGLDMAGVVALVRALG